MTQQKSAPPPKSLRQLADLRWAPFAAAFLLFAVVDLVGLLLVPAPAGRTADVWRLVLLPPVLSGVVVLFTLPSLLRLFERQEERIERQKKQIAGLHAMDTAIASEQEQDRLLAVAAREATLALDADQGGVLLLPGEDGENGGEAYHNVAEGDERDRFRELLRRGGGAAEDVAVARVPVERGGQLLGYLAVSRAREASHPGFGPDDFTLLKDLSSTVVVAVKNARVLTRARQSAAAEKVARVLQAGLLPPVPPVAGPWRISKRYEPQSDEAAVGGDIYDFFALGEDRWGVMIADVSGKGLAAARKTAMVKYALRAFAREHASPARVLARLNDVLCDEDEMQTGFVTLVYGVLDASGDFTYASAGHETPLVCRANPAGAPVEMLDPTGLVLGAIPRQAYRESKITLHAGDGLLLYTDGLSEARPEGTSAFLEVQGLARILQDCCSAAPPNAAAGEGDPDTVVNAVFEGVTAYANGRQADDVALLWIQRAAP